MNEPVIIVGAGPSGLYAASLLSEKGIECVVLEARERIGGRVLTSGVEGRPELGRFDLGPTWFWPQQEPVISKLVEDLQLRTMEQYEKGAFLFEQSEMVPVERHILPANAASRMMRLTDGMDALTEAMAARLAPGTIRLSVRVEEIQRSDAGLLTLIVNQADGRQERMRASAVIMAVNPRMIAERISFSPRLPAELERSLLNKPTWMGRQAKAVAIYDSPFWREAGLSGHGISRTGTLDEIHDASNETGSGALFGFFNMPPEKRAELGREQVLERVIEQLVRMYGPAARNPVAMLYKDWANDPVTAVPADWNRLHAFPEYGLPEYAHVWGSPALQFASTETASYQGGHLEGALRSAERAVAEILRLAGR